MGTPSQYEYEQNELRMAHVHEQRIDNAPLAERKDAQREFRDAMAESPGVVAERISWLVDGNYGYGAMLKAKQILASPRMNRRAALVQSVAVFEWMCPRRMAVDAWKKLTGPQKQLLDAAVDVVIEEADKQTE